MSNILAIWRPYKELFKNEFKSNGDIAIPDSSNYFDEIDDSIFFDSVHVSDYGNKIYCKVFNDLKNGVHQYGEIMSCYDWW